MERRHLIGGGLAAGMTGLAAGGSSAAAAQQDSSLVAGAIRDLSSVVDAHLTRVQSGPLAGVGVVRQQQRTFLRANHKYPDFMEVGMDVWESVYFWHVQHRQPMQVGQLNDGRYTLVFMFTTLIMRPDTDPDYVGAPFDRSATR